MADWPVFEVQITLHVRAISAAHANHVAQEVMMDGRKLHDSAYIHYIEDVIQLSNPQRAESKG